MATFNPHHISRRPWGLPRLNLEDFSSLGEPDSPSSGNQSPVSNTKSHKTSQDTILPEEFFHKGFVPPYNPPLLDPLGPMLVQVAPIPIMSSLIPTSNIPMMTNGLGSFVDNVSPPSLPLPMVSTTQLIGHPTIQTMPSLRNLVTPVMSGILHIPFSTTFVSSYEPPAIARSSVVSMNSFSNPFV